MHISAPYRNALLTEATSRIDAIKNYKEATEKPDAKPEVVEHDDGSMSITSPWASFKDDDKDGPTFLT